MNNDLSIDIFASNAFPNKQSGFMSLIKWINRLIDPSVKVHFVMEATGVYHQRFAYFLDDRGCDLSIVLPNKSAIICGLWRSRQLQTSHVPEL